LSHALEILFPEYSWQPWRFSKTPQGFWANDTNVRKYLIWLAEELRLSTMNDWNQVSHAQVTAHRGWRLLHYEGGLSALLAKYFPDIRRNGLQSSRYHPFVWNSIRLQSSDGDRAVSSTVSKAQLHLFRSVRILFQEDFRLVQNKQSYNDQLKSSIYFNFRHPRLQFSKTSQRMELDIYIPEYSLVIEYQGSQHFQWHYKFGSPDLQRERDEERRTACSKLGLTLIEIPF